MISTVEEALLLLNKWISEESEIVALVSFPFPSIDPSQSVFVVRFSGQLKEVSPDGVFVLRRNAAKDDFLISSIAGCSYGYNTQMPPALPDDMMSVMPDWDSSLFVQFPSGGAIVLFAEEKEENGQQRS